jgi:excisionase family DNA binding protein
MQLKSLQPHRLGVVCSSDRADTNSEFFDNSIVLLTAQEAACRLRVATKTIYEWARIRRIHSVRLGKSVRFKADVIEEVACGIRSLL